MEFYQNTYTDDEGSIINGATVTVFTSTGATATIYDSDGNAQSNPFVTGLNRSEGEIEFAAANGIYDIKIENNDEVDWLYAKLLLDPSAFAFTLLDDADQATAQATLGLVIGTNVQAYDAELAAIAGLTSAANKVPYFTGSETAGLLDFLDEDDMASDSATAVASQQSVKAYVDGQSGQLLAETTVTGSAVTSVQFTGLDISAHNSYRVEMEIINATASVVEIYGYVNGDTTATDYYTQEGNSNGGTANSANANNPAICNMLASQETKCVASLSITNDLAFWVSQYSKGRTTGLTEARKVTYKNNATVSNITQLDFTATVASSIGVGSKIRIYRGDI